METLKKLRKQRNLLQKDVAKFLGVDRTTYVKYENGNSEPNQKTLSDLADYFDVTVDFLLGKEKTAILSDDGLNAEFTSLFSQLGAVEQNIVLSQIKGILLAKEL